MGFYLSYPFLSVNLFALDKECLLVLLLKVIIYDTLNIWESTLSSLLNTELLRQRAAWLRSPVKRV